MSKLFLIVSNSSYGDDSYHVQLLACMCHDSVFFIRKNTEKERTQKNFYLTYIYRRF
jgi:hypothetical protein